MSTGPHVPVMLREVLAWLEVVPGGTYVDCTAGAGGHAEAVAGQLGPEGRLIALDQDASAVAMAGARLARFAGARVEHSAYGQLNAVLDRLGVGALDGVLIDAGCSSMQLDQPGRGFSFQSDGPLDMRMDPSAGVSAADLLAERTPEEIAALLLAYGDVPYAGRIARCIAARAGEGRLARTGDLVAAVKEALPHVQGMPEEVRTVFQAVRIAVNRELEELEAGARQAVARLRPGGRLVVITFHSGEDRVIKDFFREASRTQLERWPDGRTRHKVPPVVRLLTPKPVLPGAEEMRVNPRSKSAKLRAVERLPGAEEPRHANE